MDWLRSFRAIFLGGSPAWPALLHRARAERLPLAPCYGATETAAQVCALRPEEFLAGADGVGRALPHARIEIVDERTHAPLPPGQAGGIRITSAALFRGYWPGLADSGASYLTNDRGSVDERGFLFVHGRIDDVINTGGEKVAPGEVEATLRSTHLVRDAAVIGVPDPTWGEIVVAVVAGLSESSREELQQALRAALAPHQVPKQIIAVSAVPRNAAGKLDRAALRALILAHELEDRP